MFWWRFFSDQERWKKQTWVQNPNRRVYFQQATAPNAQTLASPICTIGFLLSVLFCLTLRGCDHVILFIQAQMGKWKCFYENLYCMPGASRLQNYNNNDLISKLMFNTATASKMDDRLQSVKRHEENDTGGDPALVISTSWCLQMAQLM